MTVCGKRKTTTGVLYVIFQCRQVLHGLSNWIRDFSDGCLLVVLVIKGGLRFACSMLGKSSKHILPNGGEKWRWIPMVQSLKDHQLNKSKFFLKPPIRQYIGGLPFSSGGTLVEMVKVLRSWPPTIQDLPDVFSINLLLLYSPENKKARGHQFLVGAWTTHLKNMLVKLDHLPR